MYIVLQFVTIKKNETGNNQNSSNKLVNYRISMQ